MSSLHQPATRRGCLRFGVALLAAPMPGAFVFAQDADALAQRLRAGGCALLWRHAQTDAGIGDPPGFRLDACSTQRNLSAAGRAQAQAAGRWFGERQLQPAAVRSSAWCRCRDTAQLAFGRHTVWAPLNSTFRGQGDPGAAQQALRAALQRIAPGSFEVWVTHQVNITALTGEYTSMGEALAVDGSARVVARGQPA